MDLRETVRKCKQELWPFSDPAWRYWSGTRKPEFHFAAFAPTERDGKVLDGIKIGEYSFNRLRPVLEFTIPALEEATGCTCFVPKQTVPVMKYSVHWDESKIGYHGTKSVDEFEIGFYGTKSAIEKCKIEIRKFLVRGPSSSSQHNTNDSYSKW